MDRPNTDSTPFDTARFDLIGNVGTLEIKSVREGRKIAILSLATSERWKTEAGERQEKTYWHRIAVFAPAKVALIEADVQKGTRLRVTGQIRPGSWEDDRGQTRYSVEFVVTGVGQVEILARPKPKATPAEPAVAAEAPSKAPRRKAA